MTEKAENSIDVGATLRRSIPCPFVYADGRSCKGHIVHVEAYNADISWSAEADGSWSFDFKPGSHYHVFCSEKGNHAGLRQDPAAMKFWLDALPSPLREILEKTRPDLT